jgi:hypothetical protein
VSRRNYVPMQIKPGGYRNLMYLLGVFHSRASGAVAILEHLKQPPRGA